MPVWKPQPRALCLDRRYPNHGRILITQISVASGVPLAWLLLKGLPLDGSSSSVAAYAIVLTIKGLMTSWAAPACNNPIFAEIVPESSRNLVYAFDRSFEGALSALGAPLVGYAAEKWFGFAGVAGNASESARHIPA